MTVLRHFYRRLYFKENYLVSVTLSYPSSDTLKLYVSFRQISYSLGRTMLQDINSIVLIVHKSKKDSTLLNLSITLGFKIYGKKLLNNLFHNDCLSG